jgi:hypothetical protein
MARSQQPRKIARVSKSIERRLNMYALAAGAAGVGAMALAQAAEAKIVYTPANEKVGPVAIDLNHDGIVDFYIASFGREGSGGLVACQYAGQGTSGFVCNYEKGTNGIRTVSTAQGSILAAALWRGEAVQPDRDFRKRSVGLGRLHFAETTSWWGQWFNQGKGVRDHYLGLRFKIAGQVHFGWARLTVKITPGWFTATLTGYAYETIPNKPIITGQTKGPDVEIVTPDASSGSLGNLAIGRR